MPLLTYVTHKPCDSEGGRTNLGGLIAASPLRLLQR